MKKNDFQEVPMQKNKIFHILSYIPLLFLISLFIPEKDNPTVRFHCGQGMLLTIVSAACSAITRTLSFTLGWIPFAGSLIVYAFSALSGLVVFAFMIIGIVNAATDKTEPLPLIGKYAFYR